MTVPDPEPRIDAVLLALELDPAAAARVVDVLSRTVVGLALDGVSLQLRVDQSSCECEDAEVEGPEAAQ